MVLQHCSRGFITPRKSITFVYEHYKTLVIATFSQFSFLLKDTIIYSNANRAATRQHIMVEQKYFRRGQTCVWGAKIN